MSPEDVVARAATLVDGARPVHADGDVCLDVPRDRWPQAAVAVREDPQLDLGYFDLLTVVDRLDAGLDVVLHLWSVDARHGIELRARCPRQDPCLPSLAGVFAGADWHERAAAEMFGLSFTGHPRLVRLLLPDSFDGTPLRKDFVLASRVAKPWPGAKDPGESDADLGSARGRRRVLPPGVPAPGTWGPS